MIFTQWSYLCSAINGDISVNDNRHLMCIGNFARYNHLYFQTILYKDPNRPFDTAIFKTLTFDIGIEILSLTLGIF